MFPCSDTFWIVQKRFISRFPAEQRGLGQNAWALVVPRGNAPRGRVGETRGFPGPEVGPTETPARCL